MSFLDLRPASKKEHIHTQTRGGMGRTVFISRTPREAWCRDASARFESVQDSRRRDSCASRHKKDNRGGVQEMGVPWPYVEHSLCTIFRSYIKRKMHARDVSGTQTHMKSSYSICII